MQKCEVCGASWDAKQILDICPFCGADLREKLTADTIEDAFRLILERHGQDVFHSSVLLGLLGDYAPSLIKERKLVKVAVESGAYKAICESPAHNRTHIVNKYVSLLTETYFIDEKWAKKALMWCLDIFDPKAVTKGSKVVKKEAEKGKKDCGVNTFEKAVTLSDSKDFDTASTTITFEDISSLYKETIRKEVEAQGKFKELGISNFPAWLVADVYHRP